VLTFLWLTEPAISIPLSFGTLQLMDLCGVYLNPFEKNLLGRSIKRGSQQRAIPLNAILDHAPGFHLMLRL
jgi:hypothetical protein